jgi:hypothetical protein
MCAEARDAMGLEWCRSWVWNDKDSSINTALTCPSSPGYARTNGARKNTQSRSRDVRNPESPTFNSSVKSTQRARGERQHHLGWLGEGSTAKRLGQEIAHVSKQDDEEVAHVRQERCRELHVHLGAALLRTEVTTRPGKRVRITQTSARPHDLDPAATVNWYAIEQIACGAKARLPTQNLASRTLAKAANKNRGEETAPSLGGPASDAPSPPRPSKRTAQRVNTLVVDQPSPRGRTRKHVKSVYPCWAVRIFEAA